MQPKFGHVDSRHRTCPGSSRRLFCSRADPTPVVLHDDLDVSKIGGLQELVEFVNSQICHVNLVDELPIALVELAAAAAYVKCDRIRRYVDVAEGPRRQLFSSKVGRSAGLAYQGGRDAQ